MLIRLFTSKCAFYVGDSTAKVVNSEQITTLQVMFKIVLKMLLLILHKIINFVACIILYFRFSS